MNKNNIQNNEIEFNKNSINIAFISEENTKKELSISIVSLLDNASSSTKYVIYIIHDYKFSEQSIEMILSFEEKYSNCKIIFKLNDTIIGYVSNLVSQCAYNALLVSNILNEIDKCIYLSNNTIVQQDLTQLYNIDIDKACIGGVIDAENLTSENLQTDQAFDINVLLINTNFIRESRFMVNYNKLVIAQTTNKHNLKSSNIIFDKVKIFPLKYNLGAKYIYDKESFGAQGELRIDPQIIKIYSENFIIDALKDNIIFSYNNVMNPFNNPQCSFFPVWLKYFKLSPFFYKIKRKRCATPKVSVIITICNEYSLLSECLESVINQTLENIEIICVDYSSNNSSFEFLQFSARFDERITVLKEENQGTGFAKNKGLDIANGEYIMFLEPDDFLELTMLENNYKIAVENNIHVIVFDYIMYNNFTGKYSNTQFCPTIDKKVFSNKDIPNNEFNELYFNSWTKFYKTSFIKDNNIRFKAENKYNDILFSNEAIMIAEKIISNNDFKLHHRINMNATIEPNLYEYTLSLNDACSELQNKLKSSNIYDEVENIFLNLILYLNISDFNDKIEIDKIKEAYENIKNDMDNSFGICNHPKEYYDLQFYDVYYLIKNTEFEHYLAIVGLEY